MSKNKLKRELLRCGCDPNWVETHLKNIPLVPVDPEEYASDLRRLRAIDNVNVRGDLYE